MSLATTAKLLPHVEQELYSEILRVQKLLVQCYNRTADFNGEVLDLKADGTGVRPLTPERFVFRVKACLEELEEAVAAYQRGDHGEVIDAFLDMARSCRQPIGRAGPRAASGP